MIELRTRILCGLLVLLAAAPAAIPQTAQSRAPTRQVAVRKIGKSENNGSSPAPGAIPGALPGLCFQPGVGWQRILPEPPGAPATPGTNTSIVLAERGSASGANPESLYDRFSNAKQVQSAECAGNSANKKALGAGVDFTILNHPQTIRRAGSTKPATVTSRHVTPPYHAHGSAGLEAVRMMPSAMPPAPTYFASENESNARSDQVGVRAFHAYTSSIKLRRLMRNAPDFRTRIKLQQLQNNLVTLPHQTRVDTETGAAASRPRHGERANRTSSRRSDTHGRSQRLGVRP
jgi:hypothetical protein